MIETIVKTILAVLMLFTLIEMFLPEKYKSSIVTECPHGDQREDEDCDDCQNRYNCCVNPESRDHD